MRVRVRTLCDAHCADIRFNLLQTGYSALMYASENGNVEVVLKLLAAGANTEAVHNVGALTCVA